MYVDVLSYNDPTIEKRKNILPSTRGSKRRIQSKTPHDDDLFIQRV